MCDMYSKCLIIIFENLNDCYSRTSKTFYNIFVRASLPRIDHMTRAVQADLVVSR